jgi:hypothetical protein
MMLRVAANDNEDDEWEADSRRLMSDRLFAVRCAADLSALPPKERPDACLFLAHRLMCDYRSDHSRLVWVMHEVFQSLLAAPLPVSPF